MALAGGGARGFAHIGVIRALEESGITVDCLSGASIGAVVGAFYAAGNTPDQMLQIAKNISPRRLKAVSSLHFRRVALDYVEELLEQHVVVNTFEELKIPLYVNATNFQTSECVYFSSGALFRAVKASAAIPIRYAGQIIDSVMYVDGGLTNNLPAQPLRARCKVVIGVSINPVDTYPVAKMSIKQKIMQAAGIVLSETEVRSIALCDYHITIPGLGRYGLEDYQYAQEIHDLGYQAGKAFVAVFGDQLTATSDQ
ncbi:phospholipase [Bacteroidia bacterium]|nr:phospholipase [Bacteroidia bacterium]